MKQTLHSIFNLHYNQGDVLKDFSCKYYELIYLISGHIEIDINGVKQHGTANSVCFIKPNTKRSQICHEDARYSCLRFFSNSNIGNLDNGIYNIKDDELFFIFKQISAEYKQKEAMYFDICNLKISEILLKLTRTIKTSHDSTSDILAIIKEIDSTLFFDKTIGDMAQSLNYNYDYFRHKFKLITGKSPINYIVDKRIEHACELLEKNMYTCTEIAHLCGFASSSQFSQLFKRHIGISPNAYHKSNNKHSTKNQE